MATSQDEMNKQHTYRRYEKSNTNWKNWGPSLNAMIFNEDNSHKCPTYVHRTPPCQGSCPSGEDIRGYLDIIRGVEKPTGEMSVEEYAFRRSTEANPFPSVMGRVCPAPCQEGCNRNTLEDFVGINSVEQYIGDTAFTEGFKFEAAPELNGKKVAIIGGGPAGMAAAYQLRKAGVASTIFEKQNKLGGMMEYGIPGYRIPRDQLANEIQRILNLGDIEVKYGVTVGKDLAVADVEKDFDAVIWALGCQTGRGLFLDKWNDTPNCVTALNYLEQFNKGEMQYTAKKIVCVGGGDTSIDVVSVARRIGTLANYNENPEDSANGIIKHPETATADKVACDSVVLTSLFAEDQMTAAEHEVNDAKIEGVDIQTEVMPIDIITDENGRATALRMAKCTVDASGIPTAVEGTQYDVEADLIVSAIGQVGDLEGLSEFDNGRSLIDVDNFYQVSGKEGHFAIGDVIRPHLLTTAIGQASVAAETVIEYLNQDTMAKRPKVDVHHFDLMDKLTESNLSPEEYNSEDEQRGSDNNKAVVHNYEDRSENEVITTERMFLGHFGYVDRNHRSESVPSSDKVLGHFQERIEGLSADQAKDEAERCMSCGMCFECDNCVIYCPQDAVSRVKKTESTTGRYVTTDYNKCVGCHICSDVCPTGYIDMAMGNH
jgi:NADPH-dependent glutamate synthase beta subunit-like oxidoreductase